MDDRFFYFVGGDHGDWCVRQQFAIAGEPLAPVKCVSNTSDLLKSANAKWVLRGITSNERYVDYAPENEPQFDDMLTKLRASAEWKFVDREVDIRLQRARSACDSAELQRQLTIQTHRGTSHDQVLFPSVTQPLKNRAVPRGNR